MVHQMSLRRNNRAQRAQSPKPLDRIMKHDDFTYLIQDSISEPIGAILRLELNMVKGYGAIHHMLAQSLIHMNILNQRDRDRICEAIFWMRRFLVELKTKARTHKIMNKATITEMASLQTAYTGFLIEQTSKKFEIVKQKTQKTDIFKKLVDPLAQSMRTPRMTQNLQDLLDLRIERNAVVPPNPLPLPPVLPGRFLFAPPTLPQYGAHSISLNPPANVLALAPQQLNTDTSSLPQRAVPSRSSNVFGARKRRGSSSMEDEYQVRPKMMRPRNVARVPRYRRTRILRAQSPLDVPDIPRENMERIKTISRRELDDIIKANNMELALEGASRDLQEVQTDENVRGLDLAFENESFQMQMASALDLITPTVTVHTKAMGTVEHGPPNENHSRQLEVVETENQTDVMHDGPAVEVVLTGDGHLSTLEALPQDSNLPASQASQKSSSSGTTSGTYFSCKSSQPNTTDEEGNLESGDELENGAKEGIEISTNKNVEPEEDIHIVPGQGVDQGHGDAEAQMDQNDEDGEGCSGADREQEAVHNSCDGEAEMDQRGADTRMDVNLDVAAVKGSQVEEQEDAVQEMDTNESPVAPESKSWFPFGFGLGRWFRRSGGK